MDVSVVSDCLTTITSTKGLGFARFLLSRSRNFAFGGVLSLYDSLADQSTSSGSIQISTLMFAVDSISLSPVRSNHVKTVPRRLTRRKRRIQRRSLTGGDGGDECYEEFGFFIGGGDFGDSLGAGGGGRSGGGGGGRGWNFDGFGGSSRDDPSSNSYPDPAFDFVYEVLSWIVLSNCLHFAFKKFVRVAATDEIANPARDKVPIRLTSVC